MIALTAKTRNGKNKIARWGMCWRELDRRGDRLLIAAIGDNSLPGRTLPESSRWVSTRNDPDFEVSL